MAKPYWTYPWAVTPEKVQAAVRKIVEVARPRRIILFGSFVKGTLDRDSDADFLIVVGDHVRNPRKESVRIRESLGDIGMPMDILVVPQGKWRRLKETPGLIYREAMRTGRVVYESTN